MSFVTCSHSSHFAAKHGHTRLLKKSENAIRRVSVIFDVVSPTHGRVPIDPLIDFPKDLSSKMSLEVA